MCIDLLNFNKIFHVCVSSVFNKIFTTHPYKFYNKNISNFIKLKKEKIDIFNNQNI